MILRVCLLKLGKDKEDLRTEEAAGERLGRAALAHWKVREKGALQTGPGISPEELPRPVAPWVVRLMGTLGV